MYYYVYSNYTLAPVSFDFNMRGPSESTSEIYRAVRRAAGELVNNSASANGTC
jgi:hypothetical protein